MNNERSKNTAQNELPPISLLNEYVPEPPVFVDLLMQLGIKTRLVSITREPSMTKYVLEPAQEASEWQVKTIAEIIDLNFGVSGVRAAKIPNELKISVEAEKKQHDGVILRELIDSREFRENKGELPFAVGKDADGNIITGDIAMLPHMLISGSTGSGKSVFLHSIIMSLLYRTAPDKVRLMLIDTNKTEFFIYKDLPHLLMPVVSDPMRAVNALEWAVGEMMRRYALFAASGAKDIGEYNELSDKDSGSGCTELPRIVIVIDELAELMHTAKHEAEESVTKLAQLARAVGIHMLIAARSSNTDVITGLITAGIPSRTAFSVSSSADSRMLLNETGAEELRGMGDLLYKPVGCHSSMKIQGGFVSVEEIHNVVRFIKNNIESDHVAQTFHGVELQENKSTTSTDNADPEHRDILNAAAQIIIEYQHAATALLQRKLRISFPKAKNIMDALEQMGLVGPADGYGSREIRMTLEQWQERKAALTQDTKDQN